MRDVVAVVAVVVSDSLVGGLDLVDESHWTNKNQSQISLLRQCACCAGSAIPAELSQASLRPRQMQVRPSLGNVKCTNIIAIIITNITCPSKSKENNGPSEVHVQQLNFTA
jgi:hypothetical protein